MYPSEYEIWVDDHNIDDDGNIVGLVRHARDSVDPQVAKRFMVGDGEQAPFPATVIERIREGLIILRAEDGAARIIAGHAGSPTPSLN